MIGGSLRVFSPGTPASSTTKTGRHDIAEILLKVALSTKINQYFYDLRLLGYAFAILTLFLYYFQ